MGELAALSPEVAPSCPGGGLLWLRLSTGLSGFSGRTDAIIATGLS
jgi:hypothetical protein